MTLTKKKVMSHLSVVFGYFALALILVKLLGLITVSPWRLAPYGVAFLVCLLYFAAVIADRKSEKDPA